MTADGDNSKEISPEITEKLAENLQKVESLARRFTEVMARRKPHDPGLDAPNQELFARAATAYWAEAVQNPSKIMEHQVEYWSDTVRHFVEAQQALSVTPFAVPENTGADDKRFSNPLWDTNPYFNFVKQQYQINSRAIEAAVQDVDDMSDNDKRRLDYFSRQIIDMMAPTNFLATNPDALERAMETDGQSLIDGLENLVADLEANDGELVVRLADETAFKLGENIATTPGRVVYRNRMMELIQYSPATEDVYEIPIILFPPWINKFYILDLKEQNSLIKWITEQGYTLFVVSWINPDHSYADTGMDDYVRDGFLRAIEEVKTICGTEQVNTIGYCIAGTTLALTLALMKQRGDTSVRSASFFTALTDFADQGDFSPFLQDDFVDAIRRETEENGIMRSFLMARTFSFLRANDLVYRPAIRSYLMGQTPPAFDLLFWNGDGTNLPGRMALEYLVQLFQGNEFASEDGFELMGHTLRISDIDLPVMSISCETDHIAPWKSCYAGVQQMGSADKTFVVSESGHIAGIVNPPSKKKYGHYTNSDLTADAATWLSAAQFNEGSWWPRWDAWLGPRSGDMVPARQPGDSGDTDLGAAPGSYVALERST